MKSFLTMSLPVLLVLTACGGSQPTTQEDKALIEKCWQNAGIESDLYKFMSIGQARGLVAGGVVSETQAVSFKQCLNA